MAKSWILYGHGDGVLLLTNDVNVIFSSAYKKIYENIGIGRHLFPADADTVLLRSKGVQTLLCRAYDHLFHSARICIGREEKDLLQI